MPAKVDTPDDQVIIDMEESSMDREKKVITITRVQGLLV